MFRTSGLPLLFAAGLAACGEPVDGRWRLVSLDGQPETNYWVVVEDGRIVGGYDGCNTWSYDPQTGRRERTLVLCLPPGREIAYRSLVSAPDVRLELDPQRRLVASGAGHRAVFIAED